MNTVCFPGGRAAFVHRDAEELALAVARRIADLAEEAIAVRGAFHLVLAGGGTPRRCYEKLRSLPIDWARVQIYFGDERCLPCGDARRNDTMARDALLAHVAIPPENIHAIPVELGTREAAAAYAAMLKPVGQLDLVLLGIGEDGHTASLFPGNPATESAEAVVPVFDSPKPPAERVSLGMGTLNAAHRKLFLVAGAGKHDALERLSKGAPLPAASITDAEWHFDRAAWSE